MRATALGAGRTAVAAGVDVHRGEAVTSDAVPGEAEPRGPQQLPVPMLWLMPGETEATDGQGIADRT